MKVVGIYIQDSETLEYNRVDLFDDEKISVTSSIQNINDIAKTYTDFSQTFTVPASKQNNKIFRHWYDNSNDTPFSTLTKSNAYIEIDTIPFRKGKIQLESANVVDGKAQDYSITFIGILGNLKDTFAGKYLKDLNLDTSYDFEYTADEVLSKVTGDGASEDVMFPLISSKRLWGYGDGNGVTNNIANEDYPIRYNELFPAIRLRAVLNMIETQFGINFDGTIEEPSTFLSDARFTNAYLYLKNGEEFKTNLFQQIDFTTKGNLEDLPGVTVNLDENYFIRANGGLTRITITPQAGYTTVPYTVKRYLDGEVWTTYTDSNGGTSIFTVRTDADNKKHSFYIETSQEFQFTFKIEMGTYISGYTKSATMNVQTLSSNLSIITHFPEIKIEDFFSGLLKMFNLTCYSTDGINYTVEQLESYYSDGSDIDITKYVLQDKKALNRVKTYKKINFDYEKSESFINVDFNSRTGIEYGSLRYVNSPPTEGEEYSVKLPFEDLNFSNLNALLQVGYCLKTDYLNYNPKPIILYDYNSANATTAPEFYWSNLLDATGVAFTKYKAFGQETLISGETYGLNFNQQQSTLTNEIVDNSLYQNYYQQYFANIYNYKARLIKLSAILPTSVLTSLKLNDSIIIRDSKYLINTYTTDLTTGLVQFELLTDERVREGEVVPGSVLNLDAGNPLSYPGTGTIWTDLSGNNNNGTLVNGPTFDPANDGSIVFDGVNQYVNCGNASNLKFTNNFTINVWVKFNSLLGAQTIISNNESGGYGIFANLASSRLETFYWINGSYIKAGENMSNYNTSSWFNISVTFNGSNILFYRNGNLIQNVSAIGTVSTTNEPLVIGANPQANGTSFVDFFNGKISQAQAYNKVLTPTEVLENYNATKGRYGL